MKVNFSRITDKDKRLLAELYESDHYKAFKKVFIENAQIKIAQDGIFGTEQIKFQSQGAIMMLKQIEVKLKEIYKKSNEMD